LFSIELYREDNKKVWDDFVSVAKNATFMFYRDYMEYHRDRFEDFSLLIYDEKGHLIALLPANREGETLACHRGLSYGGFLTGFAISTNKFLHLFEETMLFLKDAGFIKLFYKTIPAIYHQVPAEEDRYALFLANARLVRCDLLSTIRWHELIRYQKMRVRGIKKARQAGLEVRLSNDYQGFWSVLCEVLQKRHAVTPVHSLAEIERLHELFPRNIKLFCCYENGEMLGGSLIYESKQVAHCQYQATDDRGKAFGALDLIYQYLLEEVYLDMAYFDFGNSNEEQGRKLNIGLCRQKEGFGARALVHQYYELDLTDFRAGRITGALI